MKNVQNNRAVIYCRVSTKEQVEEGNSLTSQEKNCRDYAFKHGFEIVAVFIEQGESAKTAQRTELQRLMEYCRDRKNGVNAVIAYKIDRISRNMDDYSQIRIMLKHCGVDIKSTSEHFEDTPAGKFMENIIANVAQFDNDVRTERSIGGMRDAVREGRYVWMAPPGYSNIKLGGKATIMQNEYAPLVKRAFELVLNGYYSTEKIRHIITDEGLVTNRGNKISNSHFRKILHNPLYAGIIKKFGEKHYGLFSPIVSETVFDQVQWVLDGKTKMCRQYVIENPDFPLRRFVRDEHGIQLTGAWSKGRRKKYAYYWFPKTKSLIQKKTLEEKFVSFLNHYQLSLGNYGRLRKFLWKHWISKMEHRQKSMSSFEQQIQQLNERESNLVKKNISGVINDMVLKKQLEEIETEIRQLQLRSLKMNTYKLDADYVFNRARNCLVEPGKTWITASPENRLKLQWFKFPSGIVFDGINFRTTEICKLFKLIETFFNSFSYEVPSKISQLNTPEIENTGTLPNEPLNKEELAEAIGKELIELSNVFKEKEPDPFSGLQATNRLSPLGVEVGATTAHLHTN